MEESWVLFAERNQIFIFGYHINLFTSSQCSPDSKHCERIGKLTFLLAFLKWGDLIEVHIYDFVTIYIGQVNHSGVRVIQEIIENLYSVIFNFGVIERLEKVLNYFIVGVCQYPSFTSKSLYTIDCFIDVLGYFSLNFTNHNSAGDMVQFAFAAYISKSIDCLG